jgi:hypothetical protein
MNPITAMKVSFFFPLIFLSSFLFSQQADTLESKGAIIIASLEGQVTVVNNTTQEPLPASQVKAGGLLVDGHTVKTGPASKVILLLSNGTVSTIKSDSSLNIKKFTQAKFDASGKKLSDMKGEPSSSQTVMDLELGDMVFDVKKLDKRSSFNIESPVGTAGIRGTSGQMAVLANQGNTNLNINMFKGSVATQLKGSNISTLVRQGQSFSAGISASGIILPPTLGKVPTSILASIEADLEASEGATGVTSVGDSTVPAGEGGENIEDEAPSEEELQEQDADQAAAAKGIDDNGSSEAVALDKAGLIDLNDPEKLDKVDTYVEATVNAAVKFKEKKNNEDAVSDTNGAQRYRRNSNGELEKNSGSFLADLVSNLDDVVDVTVEAEDLGIDKVQMFDSLLENSENSGAVKEVVTVAAKIGAKDKESLQSVFTNVDQADAVKEVVSVAADLGAQDKDNLGAVFKNADKADDLKEVMAVAKETLGTDDGSGTKKLDASKASILSSTLKNADKADSMKSVMEDAAALGAQDAENLTAVFANADKADDLKEVMAVAKKTLGTDDGSGTKKLDASKASILSSTLKNADKADSMKSVMDDAAALGAQDAENLTAVFANADKADDLKEVMAVAKENLGKDDGTGVMKFDATNASVLTNTLKNADKASDLREVVTKAETAGAISSLDTMLANADKATDLKEVVAKAESAGASASLGTMFANADRADEFKRVTDQLDTLELEGGSLEVFEQIENVADVFDAVAGDGDVDQDFAKNILGNAAAAADIKEAVILVKGNDGFNDSQSLADFAMKDVNELKAINEVAGKLDVNSRNAFISGGIDDALQLKHAIDSSDDSDFFTQSLSDSLAGGKSISEAVGESALNKLQSEYNEELLDYINEPAAPRRIVVTEFLDIIETNKDRAQDISFALSFVEKESPQESALLANIDKLDAIMNLSHKYQDDTDRMIIIFNNLDVAGALDVLSRELSIYPKRLEVVFENADLAPAILSKYNHYETLDGGAQLISSFLSSTSTLKTTLSRDGLNSLEEQFPQSVSEINNFFSNQNPESEISPSSVTTLIDVVGVQHGQAIIDNLSDFKIIETLVFRAKQDPAKINSLFGNLTRINEIMILSELFNSANVAGGQNAIFSNLDLLFGSQADSGYLLLANDNPQFFTKISEVSGDLSTVSSLLATELEALNLNRNDLSAVLSDIVNGPMSDGPTTQPPAGEGLSEEFAAVSILESHAFNGAIPEALVLSEEQVRLSNLFKETLDVFDALDTLFYSPSSESVSSSQSSPLGLLGGVNLTFTSGNYDLSNLGYDSLLIAASNNLSVSGSLAVPTTTILDELHFIAGGSLQILEGSSINSSAISLGFGSFDSIEIVNVDLHAEGEIGVRSLDSIIINNSDFATRGTGADHIHLVAAADLAIDNLRFSEQVRQITMEAMTINLSNLNFPAGSAVNLNSAYGGIDGVYPNFGSSAVGRVNFIENVRYSSHLLNSRSAFDSHGGAISIGIKSN